MNSVWLAEDDLALAARYSIVTNVAITYAHLGLSDATSRIPILFFCADKNPAVSVLIAHIALRPHNFVI